MMSNGGNPYLIPTLSEAQIKELVDANALPTVTSADAGKVLTVSESGSWTAAEGGGGASGLVVNITEDTTTSPVTYILDKNYLEITSSILNGIMPVFIIEQTQDGTTFYAIHICVGYAATIIPGTSDLVYMIATKEILGQVNYNFQSDSEDGVLIGRAQL